MKKENKPLTPTIQNPDMEYIYYGNSGSLKLNDRISYDIGKKQIVKNIKLLKDGNGHYRYEFEIKETGEIFYTDCGTFWCVNNFYENTDENKQNFKDIKKLSKNIDKLKKEFELIALKIKKL